MQTLHFRIIHDPSNDRYVGEAYLTWTGANSGRVLITRSHPNYTGAREQLGRLAEKAGYELKWFDGEWSKSGDGPMEKICPVFMRGHTIKHGSQTGLTVDYTQIKHGCNWVVAHDADGQRYDLVESACSLDR